MNTKIPLRFLGICCALAVLLALPGVANAAPLDPAPNVGGSTTSPSCLPPPSGLAAWYPFDGNAADAAGANHATISGTASFAPGAVGNALQFDGTTTSAKAVASPALDVGTGDGLTIEAWISPADATTSYPIMEWNNAAAGGVFGTHLFISETFAGGVPGGLFLNLNDKTDTPHVIRSTAAVISAQTYQHVAATYDRTTGNATLYLNGVPLAVNGSTTPGPVNLGIFTPQTSYDLYLGHRPSQGDPNAGRRYNGALDEVGIYNRALTQGEIQAIFDAGSAGKCGAPDCTPAPSDLNAWYPGDGDARDLQGGKSGTLKNGATFAPGKVGQAFSLDGVDDFVEIPHNRSLNNPPRITLAAWIKPDTIKAGSRIISKDSSATSCTAPTVAYSLEVRGLQGNKADFFFTTGDKAFHELVGTSVIPTDVFTHVAATYDGSTAKIYVNGVLESSLSASGTSLAKSNAPVIIGGGGAGCRASNGGQIEFDGLIDEVEIFNRALTEAEISAIVNAGSGGICGPPRTAWGAGRDLLANEKPDNAAEANAHNTAVPEWSYGTRAQAATTELNLFRPELHENRTDGLEGWYSSGAVEGVLAVNVKSTPLVLEPGVKGLLTHQLDLHPTADNRSIVARWTTPKDGDYRMAAKWFDLDARSGDGVSAHLVINGQEKFVQLIPNGGNAELQVGPASTFSLKAGDLVDFVVGPRGNYFSDSTAFNAVIAPVPHVVVNAPTKVNAGEDVPVTVTVQHPYLQISSVELRVNGKGALGPDATAPYEFTIPKEQIDSPVLALEAIATDKKRAQGRSAPVQVTIQEPDSGAAMAARAAELRSTQAAAGPQDCVLCVIGEVLAAFDFIFIAESGEWHDPNNWLSRQPGEIPGPFDDVLIGDSTVTVNNTANAGTVYLIGLQSRIVGGLGEPEVHIFRELSMENGTLSDINLLVNKKAKVRLTEKSTFSNVFIEQRGELQFSGIGRFPITNTRIVNLGTVIIETPPVSANGPEVPFTGFENKGELRPTAGSILELPPGAKLSGNTAGGALPDVPPGLDPPKLIGGGTLIGLDGSTLIGLDGSTLIGNDGSTLIGNDGSTLAAINPAQLITESGSTIAPAKQGEGPLAAKSTTANGIILEGGTFSGTIEIVGDVLNQAAFLAPGDSAGGILIRGNYTQESAATLVLEIGGTATDPMQYDIFQATGTATLGGNLVVKTIDDYTPSQTDALSPLLFASSSGNFANISSNAQVTFGPNGAQINVAGPNPPAPKALNIATRMKVETGDNVLIAGFIITGNAPKKVIIRGIGPSLPFGGILADPTLDLDNGAVTNDNWRTNQEQEIIATTIPPSNELESAIVATLSPGPHTAILRGSGDGTGIGVVEVYDLESGSPVQLANISSRGFVQTGDDVMIGGFIIGGTYPAKVIVRAIGPSLPFQGKLENPTLELVNQNGGSISNDNWRETQEADITATTIPPTQDKEAAIVATLAPGPYTAIVRGVDDTTGIAVVEAYNLQ